MPDLELPHRPERPADEVAFRCPRCLKGMGGSATATVNLPKKGPRAVLETALMAKHYEEEHEPLDEFSVNGFVIWRRNSGDPPPWDDLIENLREQLCQEPYSSSDG